MSLLVLRLRIYPNSPTGPRRIIPHKISGNSCRNHEDATPRIEDRECWDLKVPILGDGRSRSCSNRDCSISDEGQTPHPLQKRKTQKTRRPIFNCARRPAHPPNRNSTKSFEVSDYVLKSLVRPPRQSELMVCWNPFL